MSEGVLGEVMGTTHESDEDILGRRVGNEGRCDDEPWKNEPISRYSVHPVSQAIGGRIELSRECDLLDCTRTTCSLEHDL